MKDKLITISNSNNVGLEGNMSFNNFACVSVKSMMKFINIPSTLGLLYNTGR